MTTLVIVNSNELLRLGLRTAMETAEDIDVIGEFAPHESVVDRVVDLGPDILLIESGWPTLEVQVVCGKILHALPSTVIVMTTATGSDEEILAARAAGASVCVPGTVSASELVQSIRTVLDGGARLDRKRASAGLRGAGGNRSESKLDLLTDRELEILSLVGAGYRNDEIGRALNLATGTVRNNITRIRSKLDIHYRPQLVRFAGEQGLRYDPERALVSRRSPPA